VRIQQGGGETAEDVEKGMRAIVEGELASLDQLGRLPNDGKNFKSLRKVSSPPPSRTETVEPNIV